MIQSSHPKTQKIRIEYAIDYVKKMVQHQGNFCSHRKDFFNLGRKYTIYRKLPFHNMTTRTHYAGIHRITLILNGVSMASTEFILL
jgi:hypothetical protein